MTPNLDSLKNDIEEYLKSGGFSVFHGFTRHPDSSGIVLWDTEQYPDFRLFLELAAQLGAGFIVYHSRKLAPDFIDDALDQLEAADLPEEEYAEMERRLRELRVFEGFTSAVELAFFHEGRCCVYASRSEWFEELLEIAEEIEDYGTDGDGRDEDDMGRYFSKN